MSWSVSVVPGLMVCSVCVVAAVGQEPPMKSTVESRRVETERVEGLNEGTAFLEGVGGVALWRPSAEKFF